MAIATFTLFPFLILWGISCYCCCVKEGALVDLVSLSNCDRTRSTLTCTQMGKFADKISGGRWSDRNSTSRPNDSTSRPNASASWNSAATSQLAPPTSEAASPARFAGRNPMRAAVARPDAESEGSVGVELTPTRTASWECPTCTFQNAPTASSCTMCATAYKA